MAGFSLGLLAMLALGAVIRMAAHSNYAFGEGSYAGVNDYSLRYMLQTGHELKQSSLPYVTSYSGGIYEGNVDLFVNKLTAAVMAITGLGPGDLGTFQRFGMWAQLLFFPAALLALYALYCRRNGNPVRLLPAILLTGFATSGVFNLIDNSPGGGFPASENEPAQCFMLLALYALLLIDENAVIGRLFFFIFSACVILSYHSAALQIALSVTAVAILALIDIRLRRSRASAESGAPASETTMGVVVIIGVAYFMYVSVRYFDLLSSLLAQAPSLLAFIVQQTGTAPRQVGLTPLLANDPRSFFLATAAHGLVLAALVVIVMVLPLAARWITVSERQAALLTSAWMLAIVPFTGFAFLWLGLTGVLQRSSGYGSFMALIAAAFLLAATIGRFGRAAVYAAIACSIGLTTFLYTLHEKEGSSYVTPAENEASSWVAHRATPQQAVFTEFRLAGRVVAAGHVGVEGINDYSPVSLVKKQMREIYYGASAQQAARGLASIYTLPQASLRYGLFSRRTASQLPGVHAYDFVFKGPKAGFTKKFGHIPGSFLVFNDGTSRVYEFTKPLSASGQE